MLRGAYLRYWSCFVGMSLCDYLRVIVCAALVGMSLERDKGGSWSVGDSSRVRRFCDLNCMRAEDEDMKIAGL